MKKLVLFTASVDSHISGFHKPYINLLSKKGFSVDIASKGNSNFNDIRYKYNVSFPRKPIEFINFLRSFSSIRKILLDNNYHLIHTHTPFTSLVVRIALLSIKNKVNTKVIYTAHGFHFFKGASILSWVFFYPIEKFLSKFTDLIITINQEDFEIASKTFFCKVIKINGVGFKTNNSVSPSVKKTLDFFDIISVGELNKNKNQILIIKSVQKLLHKYPFIRYNIVGDGRLKSKLVKYVNSHNLQNNIFFLGFRNDIYSLLSKSNLLISSSLREGLPINVLESLNSGTPILLSKIRGHIDICHIDLEVMLFDLDLDSLVYKLEDYILNYKFYINYIPTFKKVLDRFDIQALSPIYEQFYLNVINGEHNEEKDS
jgi:glycosyltransferase EpsD